MCSWVSISVLQNLHWLSVLDPFFKLFFTGSIDALVFIMALHCFLVNFSIYSGLLPTLISFFLSFQCLIFVIVSDSFSITSITLVFISPWRCFFRHSYDITAIRSLTLSSSAILFISFLHSLFFDEVTSLMRDSFCMLSIRLACKTCFFFIMCSIG